MDVRIVDDAFQGRMVALHIDPKRRATESKTNPKNNLDSLPNAAVVSDLSMVDVKSKADMEDVWAPEIRVKAGRFSPGPPLGKTQIRPRKG